MALTCLGDNHGSPGKTSEDTDVVEGRFAELVSDLRLVHLVTF
ncbi:MULTISPECIES: hypothetical protein [unclassified Mesorhizobium]|nr:MULTISPECIES: hypothetical protein [unclassified Mesorhizobium]